MSISAAVLLLATVPGTTPATITPVSLSMEPRVVNLGDSPYDWGRQRGPSAAGADLKRVAQTATCDTVMSTTNNGQDTVPDCRFD